MNLKFLKFKEKKVFKKGSDEINPNPFWNVVLMFTAIMIVFAFSFTFLVFQKVNKEVDASSSGVGSEAAVLPKERLDKILQYFQEKEEKSKEIFNAPAPVIDPSL